MAERTGKRSIKPVSGEGFSAVLFDMDGTVCNTEDIYRQAWAETFTYFGLPPDLTIVESLRGL